jgi:hypothetical protein
MWSVQEENYLTNLANTCEELSTRFKFYYDKYKLLQTKFRLPNIIVSAALGLLSIGNANIEPSKQQTVNIIVGISGAFLTVLNSVEGFLMVGQTMAGCLGTSIILLKLVERIRLELALPAADRSTTGLMFVREMYVAYEKALETAPSVIKTVRFIGTKAPFSAVSSVEPPASLAIDL